MFVAKVSSKCLRTYRFFLSFFLKIISTCFVHMLFLANVYEIKLQHPSSWPNSVPDTLIENANECGATWDGNAGSQDAPPAVCTDLPTYVSTLQFIMRTSHTEMDLQLQTCLPLMRVYFQMRAERTATFRYFQPIYYYYVWIRIDGML